MTENPFELLRLPPSASEEEAVNQAARLCQQAPHETETMPIRQAVRQLTGSADERALYALLTHPRPEYSCPELERFVAAFRRPPAPAASTVACPVLDTGEVRTLLFQALAAEVEVPSLPLEAVAAGDTGEEIARQTAEALRQSLISDSRA